MSEWAVRTVQRLRERRVPSLGISSVLNFPVSSKYSFKLKSEDQRRDLPEKIIIGRQTLDTAEHVVLKMLSYVLFYRERIRIDTNLHTDSIPYVPDLVQLDYELRPKLWVECGECAVSRLDKLAVKVPEAEIWVVLRSESLADDLLNHQLAWE